MRVVGRRKTKKGAPASIQGDMGRSTPPLAAFAVLSLLLHLGAAGAIRRGTQLRLPRPPPETARATPALVGDTLDVEPPADPPEDEEPGGAAGGEPAGANVHQESAARPGQQHGHRTAAPAAPASPAAPPPPQFGAVGERSAVDLPSTFARAFSQAASADPTWATVPLGPAGTAEVTLLLDDSGHLSGHTISGAPSRALRRGIDSTVVLLGARPFTARGAVTRLRVTTHVVPNDVHDGLHGDVFALSGGSFTGEVGNTWFALRTSVTGGRRVEVELRLLSP
jgi:hypothetical protein